MTKNRQPNTVLFFKPIVRFIQTYDGFRIALRVNNGLLRDRGQRLPGVSVIGKSFTTPVSMSLRIFLFRAMAKHVAFADEIILVAHGKGKSNEAAFLAEYVSSHDHALANRIVEVATLDRSALSEKQINQRLAGTWPEALIFFSWPTMIKILHNSPADAQRTSRVCSSGGVTESPL
jgi:hypothetical protein